MEIKKIVRALIVALTFVAILPFTPFALNSANAAYGELDTSYGTNPAGYNFLLPNLTINGFQIELSVANASAVDSQNRLVITGYVGYDDGDRTAAIVARFLSDGSPDASFGPNNQGYNIVSINDEEMFNGVAIQSSGKIVAVGSYVDPNTSRQTWLVTRFESNGLVDTNFGATGTGFESTTAFASSYANSILVTSTDQILVVGSSNLGQSDAFPTLAKYDANGLPLLSFGEFGSGFETITVGGTTDEFSAITLANNGEIIVVGSSNSGGTPHVLIASFSTSGVPNLSFGGSNNGFNTTTFSSSDTRLMAVSVLSSGKIIAAGSKDSRQLALLARYNANGTLDNSFGSSNNGFEAFQVFTEQYINSLVLDGADHVLVGGSTRNGAAESWFFVGRFDQNGIFDSQFGDNGIAKFNISYSDVINSLAKNSTGEILFAGSSRFIASPDESIVIGRLRATIPATTSPQVQTIPDPIQQSLIETVTLTGETATSIVLSGKFPEPIVNIVLNQEPISPTEWRQTPVSVTIPDVAPGNYVVQIFNGAVPLLPEQKVSVVKVIAPIPAPIPAPQVKVEPTPPTTVEAPAVINVPVQVQALKVYFAMASARLEESSKAAISAWFEEFGDSAQMLKITGYAQATPKGASLDPALSARRARAVKHFFIELGYTGKFRTSGAGRTTLNKAESRYVEVVTP